MPRRSNRVNRSKRSKRVNRSNRVNRTRRIRRVNRTRRVRRVNRSKRSKRIRRVNRSNRMRGGALQEGDTVVYNDESYYNDSCGPDDYLLVKKIIPADKYGNPQLYDCESFKKGTHEPNTNPGDDKPLTLTVNDSMVKPYP